MTTKYYEDAEPFIIEHRTHGGIEVDVDFNARLTTLHGVAYLPGEVVCHCGARYTTLVVAGEANDQNGHLPNAS